MKRAFCDVCGEPSHGFELYLPVGDRYGRLAVVECNKLTLPRWPEGPKDADICDRCACTAIVAAAKSAQQWLDANPLTGPDPAADHPS